MPNIPSGNTNTTQSTSLVNQPQQVQQKKYALPGDKRRNAPLAKSNIGKAPMELRHRTQADLIVDTRRSSGKVENTMSKVRSKQEREKKEMARDIVDDTSLHIKGDYEIDAAFAHKNISKPITSLSRMEKVAGIKEVKVDIQSNIAPKVDDLQID